MVRALVLVVYSLFTNKDEPVRKEWVFWAGIERTFGDFCFLIQGLVCVWGWRIYIYIVCRKDCTLTGDRAPFQRIS